MNTKYFDEKRRAIPYPKVLTRPYLKKNATSAEAREFADALEKYEVEKFIYLAEVKKANIAMSEVDDEFTEALFEDLGIVDNPKKDLLYSKAYELGHSGGYSEIYSYACDLVDLIR